MKQYELVVLLHPDLEIDVDAPIAKIEKLVETADGKVTKRDNWGKRRLAYQVKHQEFAVYIYFELQLNPEKVPAFERGLSLAEEIMRHLIVVQEEEKKVAKPTKTRTKVGATTTEEATDGEKL